MKFEDFFPRTYVKASDLNGKDLTLTIRRVERKEFEDGTKPVLWFEEITKALILNRTNFSIIEKLWGEDTDHWIDKSITLFPTEVSYLGEMRMGIRVRSKAPDARPITEDDIEF